MASPQDAQHIKNNLSIEMWDHDPGSTCAVLVSPDGGTTIRSVDMKDNRYFACAAMSSTLTGAGITLLEIVASVDTAFTAVTVIKSSGTVVADAVGDWVIEECSAEEIAQEAADAGVALRYVAGRITVANAADEAVVTYISVPVRSYQDLTPETTIA